MAAGMELQLLGLLPADGIDREFTRDGITELVAELHGGHYGHGCVSVPIVS